MIARALGVLALAASASLASPWLSEPTTRAGTGTGGTPVPVPAAAADPEAALHAAIATAAARHVPGAAGRDWLLDEVKRSAPGLDGRERIVATGLLATPGAPDTRVRLSGRFDPATGELVRIAYRLEAADADPRLPNSSTPADADPAWTVQQAVHRALSEALPGEAVAFALSSAQAVRLDGGGRRFDGYGVGNWGDGEPRFVAFTLTLSVDGEPVAFDYGTPLAPASETAPLALADVPAD